LLTTEQSISASRRRGKVANGNLLAQKLLQDFLYFAQAEQLGRKFFNQIGLGFSQPIEQALGLVSGQKFARSLASASAPPQAIWTGP
jgi:hypothetical protein